MKVMTIKQPFASLIAKGYKEYEFRTWRTNYRGYILIHSGKNIDKEAIKRFKYLNLEYPLGCIIAKAKITDCIEVDNKFAKELLKKDSKVYKSMEKLEDSNRYAFKLEELEELDKIYINGKLGLWNYDL